MHAVSDGEVAFIHPYSSPREELPQSILGAVNAFLARPQHWDCSFPDIVLEACRSWLPREETTPKSATASQRYYATAMLLLIHV